MKNMRWGILKPATDQQAIPILGSKMILTRLSEEIQDLWMSICSRVYYGLVE